MRSVVLGFLLVFSMNQTTWAESDERSLPQKHKFDRYNRHTPTSNESSGSMNRIEHEFLEFSRMLDLHEYNYNFQLHQDAKEVAEYLRETAIEETLPNGSRLLRIGTPNLQKLDALISPTLERIFDDVAPSQYAHRNMRRGALIVLAGAAASLSLASTGVTHELGVAILPAGAGFVSFMVDMVKGISRFELPREKQLEYVRKKNPVFMKGAEALQRYAYYLRKEMEERNFQFVNPAPKRLLGLVRPNPEYYNERVLNSLVDMLKTKTSSPFCELYLAGNI